MTHLVVEGFVVLNASFYKSTSGNVLMEIWKEYAKADSRYVTRDSFVISMEAVTAFLWGPLSLLSVYAIAQQWTWRHMLQVVVSVGQLYGDALYFGTSYLEGVPHSRPEPLYFWFYFVFVNSIWVVIPALVLWRAACQVTRGAAAAEALAANNANAKKST
ncbi:hypothetical protein WJX81_002735 [Elliptochloris bilobata]|uniref:EXPERA domain-containing protein n=1 Tax=Elliptochloris bilobata TaxID=381761 RepID=A0AAW1SLF4_9CHLO